MLSSFLFPDSIKVGLESSEKEECFAELLELFIPTNPSLNRAEALEALLAREEKLSTAVFPFVAVPHAVCKSISKTTVVIGISKKPIEFDSVEPESTKTVPVNLIFEILFQENDTQSRLVALRDILSLVSNQEFLKEVLAAKTSQQVYDIIVSYEL